MKRIIVIFIALLLSSFVSADLSDFPDNFIDGDFDGYIVVGKDGTSVDVIAQSTLALGIASYIGGPQLGITKLDIDLSLDDGNMILIGNPCVNKLTNELLDEPEPCDEDFPAGKAYIRYVEKGGKRYIIAAGSDGSSNKAAAEFLADFDSGMLVGNEVELSTGVAADLEEVEVGGAEEEQEEEPEEEEQQEEEQEEESEGPEEEDDEEEEPAIKEDKGMLTKLLEWFASLFGK
jgi:hypothetical protein